MANAGCGKPDAQSSATTKHATNDQQEVVSDTLATKPDDSSDTCVLLSAPQISDAYYREFFDDLLEFYGRLTKAAAPGDFPVVITDEETKPRLLEHVDADHIQVANVPDIWIRDFGVVRTQQGLFKFRYLPIYLSRKQANAIDTAISNLMIRLGLKVTNVPLIIDGGNFCHNGTDKAVLTTRALWDNDSFSKSRIVKQLAEVVGSDRIAFIPEEKGDKLGHSDGAVKWISANKLAICDYKDVKFRGRVMRAIDKVFDQRIERIQMTFEPTDRVHKGFFDATGVYVNALSTPNAIYVPTYDIDADHDALDIYKSHADRPVIAIPMGSKVAQLGGSVRCLSCTTPMFDA